VNCDPVKFNQAKLTVLYAQSVSSVKGFICPQQKKRAMQKFSAAALQRTVE